MNISEFTQEQIEKLELALSYAQDVINTWPTMTIRTIGQMNTRVENLKQALEMVNSK